MKHEREKSIFWNFLYFSSIDAKQKGNKKILSRNKTYLDTSLKTMRKSCGPQYFIKDDEIPKAYQLKSSACGLYKLRGDCVICTIV